MELMVLWFGREKELTSFKICLVFFFFLTDLHKLTNHARNLYQ